MNLWGSTRLAIRGLRANRTRSLLTILSIMVGVAAVICMISVGQGAREQVTEQIRKLGTNLLLIQPDAIKTGGVRLAGTRHTLTEDDAAAIQREVPDVLIAAPVIWGKTQVIVGNKNWATTFFGNNADYLLAREWNLTAGRIFSDEEIKFGSKVAIIGQVLADKLFDGEQRVGETIRIGNVPFDIIGVLERKGENAGSRGQDDIVVIPLSVARSRMPAPIVDTINPGTGRSAQTGSEKRLATRRSIDYLVVKFDGAAEEAKRRVEELLRDRHRLSRDGANDFNIFTSEEVFATQERSAKAFSLLLLSIASISLFVGGISIMNTMLVSVTERTREIGLRLAVGARRRDIRNQFLIEAVAMALLGGILGTAAGSVTAALIAVYGGWPVLISPAAAVLACAFTSFVGVIFGLLPAHRASNLDPMVALRFE